MLRIAHISDIHIGATPQSVERTERVTRYLSQLPGPIDAVVVTGDIADHGTVEEYEIARDLLRPLQPLIVCPGNHDSRAEFRTVLLGEHGDGPVNQVLRLPEVAIALCDSSIPGRPDGLLADETLAWLDDVLATSQTPVLVGMHHPPIELGTTYVDGMRLGEPHRLAEVLLRRPQAVAVLAGHAHTAASGTFAGLPLRVAPGVISTSLLPVETEAWPPVDYDQPPAISLHVYDDGRLVTHTRVIT